MPHTVKVLTEKEKDAIDELIMNEIIRTTDNYRGMSTEMDEDDTANVKFWEDIQTKLGDIGAVE